MFSSSTPLLDQCFTPSTMYESIEFLSLLLSSEDCVRLSSFMWSLLHTFYYIAASDIILRQASLSHHQFCFTVFHLERSGISLKNYC